MGGHSLVSISVPLLLLFQQCLTEFFVCDIYIQLDHYNENEFGWDGRMLLIGFINDVGFGVMLAWLSSLSSKFDRNLQFMQFGIFV